MIVLWLLVAALGIEVVCVVATNLRALRRLVMAGGPATIAPTALHSTADVDEGHAPAGPHPTAPRGPGVARPRVTLVLHPRVHDALCHATRLALHALPLDWYVQGERVETRLAVERRSPLHREAQRLVGDRGLLVEVPEGARRCWVCGCVELYACPGGCGWHEPGRCTACALARRTVSVPRRRLAAGAPAAPLPHGALSLDAEEAAERDGREVSAARWGRRRAPVAGSALGLVGPLPSPAAQARARVVGQLASAILPAVRARGLPVSAVVVLAGFGRDVSAALAAPLDGDPDALQCLALGRAEEVYARLPSGAARRLVAELDRHPRAGLSVLWVASGRVDLVHLHHVDDALVAGRRAS
jgi:hypothetical protein